MASFIQRPNGIYYIQYYVSGKPGASAPAPKPSDRQRKTPAV